MPEVDPITREEKLWNGEDIEPITREEQYIKHIYDKTQKIPSKPITRKEVLLEKAGQGGGSDVTIKQLSVTENGTYSEEGTAYSPVVVNVPKTPLNKLTVTENGTYTAPTETGYDEVNVNVPLPSNAYLLKEIEDVDIASFSDGSNLPMPSLKIGIEPIQSGSGDPSPSNVRPISGHTEANVVVSPTTDAEDGTTYTIQFRDGDNPLTVYGGTLDVVSGVLTVDRKTYTLTGSESWRALGTGFGTGTGLSDIGTFDQNKNIAICSHFTKYNTYNWDISNGYFNIADKFIAIRDDTNFDSVEDCASYVTAQYNNNTPITICAKLATPLTIQLTPTQVKSLLGSNNVWSDTGKIEELEYFSKEV